MNALIRRDPLDELFRGFFVKPMDFPGGNEPQQFKVDVREDKESFRIHAELPGVNKDDIHVLVDGPMVSISAETRREKETREGEQVLRAERYVGKVSRTFQLGSELDDARAVAKFNDGVLELTLPKKQVAASRRLAIE